MKLPVHRYSPDEIETSLRFTAVIDNRRCGTIGIRIFLPETHDHTCKFFGFRKIAKEPLVLWPRDEKFLIVSCHAIGRNIHATAAILSYGDSARHRRPVFDNSSRDEQKYLCGASFSVHQPKRRNSSSETGFQQCPIMNYERTNFRGEKSPAGEPSADKHRNVNSQEAFRRNLEKCKLLEGV
ncbi:MAG TPA: hypothetical protein VKH62_04530 [Candidatus Binatia bacterium]|nr:hypothetical protein [Candidatus Binatia bacterium]